MNENNTTPQNISQDLLVAAVYKLIKLTQIRSNEDEKKLLHDG